MALVRELGMRGLVLMALVHAAACSDDGVPATTDDPSGTTSASVGETADSDPTSMTGTTAESSITDTGPESSGPGVTVTTTDDTSGTATSPSDTSGTSDSGSTDTGSTTGEPDACMEADECEVVDDCCSCTAIPVGAEPPACDLPNCEQSACAAAGITPVAECELGTCQLVDDVEPGCESCERDEVCVQNVAQMVTSMCVPISPECEGTPTCECMGEVCQEPFGTCNDDGEGIDCICIAC